MADPAPTGDASERRAACEAALRTRPDDAALHADLGDALQTLGELEEAIASYRRAVALDERLTRAWYAGGCAQAARKEYAEAVSCFRQALALVPDHAEAHHNLGEALFNLGQVDPALDEFREAVALGQGFVPRSAIATAIPGSPSASNASILDARRAFATHHLPPSDREKFSGRRAPLADRRLRIGYVSAFFDRENWMKPVWALIDHHDRDQFEIHLFADAKASDVRPGRPVQPPDQLHETARLSNRQIADLIERCEIDVLVDLNAYSALGRLPIFSMRPAPVIAAWFNLFATSGMDAYDYIIGDACVIPREEERHYTEAIVRVPGSYLTFQVAYPVPDVAVPPYAARARITFGCLASQYKITTEVVEAWSWILRACPQSRLVLKNAALGSVANRRFVVELFARFGIAPEQLALEGPSPHFEFLEKYGGIDLALDTFPYNGGTTTTEAIWQGVPVLTFYGDRWASRTSASILRAGGLGEFVAPDLDSHVQQAIALATSPATPARLAELRRAMRDRLRQSPVCEAAAFAAAMEREYRRMWRRWCRGEGR